MSTVDPKHFDVIVRPLVTEKSANKIVDSVYTFLVKPEANKVQIRQAIEAIWNVRVQSVRTVNTKGEEKRNKFGFFTTKTERKAYVRLKPGYEIEIL